MNATTTQPTPRSTDAPARFRWTVEALYRAIASGVFDHPERIELVHGVLLERPWQTPAHASLITHLAQVMRAAFEPPFMIREEKPLHIADDGEPVPDIMVVAGSEEDYEERHPTPGQVALLVEVADTSASYDAGGKALIYAQAGITEYWVVLLSSQEILVHRQPAAGGYGSITRSGAGDEIALRAEPSIRLTVGQLLSR